MTLLTRISESALMEPSTYGPVMVTDDTVQIWIDITSIWTSPIYHSGYSTLLSGYSTLLSGYSTLLSGYSTLLSGYSTLLSGYSTLP